MAKTKLVCAAALLFGMARSATAQDASVTADFQPLVDGTITVAEVVLPASGFLVVRLPKDNKVFHGDILAVVPLEAGSHKDLKVKLEPAPKADDTLGIILHQDDTTVGTYEFEMGKKADEPFFIGRRPVLEMIGVLGE